MFAFWRNWGFLARELRQRIAEELRFHLDKATAANVAQGMTCRRRCASVTALARSRPPGLCTLAAVAAAFALVA